MISSKAKAYSLCFYFCIHRVCVEFIFLRSIIHLIPKSILKCNLLVFFIFYIFIYSLKGVCVWVSVCILIISTHFSPHHFPRTNTQIPDFFCPCIRGCGVKGMTVAI